MRTGNPTKLKTNKLSAVGKSLLPTTIHRSVFSTGHNPRILSLASCHLRFHFLRSRQVLTMVDSNESPGRPEIIENRINNLIKKQCHNPKHLLEKSVKFCWRTRRENLCNPVDKYYYESGDEVTYVCTNPDYVLVGETQATCQYNGLWTSDSPRCSEYGSSTTANPSVSSNDLTTANPSVSSNDLYKWIGGVGCAIALLIVLICVFYRPRCGKKSHHGKCETRTKYDADLNQEEPNWFWRVRNSVIGGNGSRINDKEAYEKIKSENKNFDDVNTLPAIYEEIETQNTVDKSQKRKDSPVLPTRMLLDNKQESTQYNTYAMVEKRLKSDK